MLSPRTALLPLLLAAWFPTPSRLPRHRVPLPPNHGGNAAARILPSGGKSRGTKPPATLFEYLNAYNSGGTFATAVAVADVNGDGKADVIAASQCVSLNSCPNGVVGVLLGNGDGTFQSAVGYNSGGSEASFVAAADVNGDGKDDLLVANGTGVGVLLGNGDGTFQAANTFSAGGSGAIAVGDVNEDGRPDLIVANGTGAAVLLGNGDGTFETPTTFGSGGANAVAVADVNGDGRLDIVITNGISAGVLLGNGDGTFQVAVTYGSGGEYPTSVAVEDVNGDGKPDVVVANDCFSSTSCSDGGVGVLLGNGDGTFQTAVTYDSGGQSAISVMAEDVNQDGEADILVADLCDMDFGPCNGTVGVLLGNGDGTFQAATNYGSGYNGFDSITSGALAMRDINGDGKPDMLVASSCLDAGCSNGAVQVLLNTSLALTETTVSSSINPSLKGNPVTFTASVTSSGTPTGTVQFLNGTTVLGTIMLKAGSARYTTSQLPLGGNAITAVYSGDSNYNGSTSAPVNQMVMEPTSTILSASPNPSIYGQGILLTATVSSSLGVPPDGDTVTFRQGANILGTGTLMSGVATLTTPATGIGSVSGTAVYNGDANFAASTSQVLYEFIGQASTTMTLTSSQDPSSYGQPVTFTATVSPQFSGTPGGVVVFSNGSSAARVALVGGVATYTTSKLLRGTYTMTATYNGNADFTGSAASLMQTVQ